SIFTAERSTLPREAVQLFRKASPLHPSRMPLCNFVARSHPLIGRNWSKQGCRSWSIYLILPTSCAAIQRNELLLPGFHGSTESHLSLSPISLHRRCFMHSPTARLTL